MIFSGSSLQIDSITYRDQANWSRFGVALILKPVHSGHLHWMIHQMVPHNFHCRILAQVYHRWQEPSRGLSYYPIEVYEIVGVGIALVTLQSPPYEVAHANVAEYWSRRCLVAIAKPFSIEARFGCAEYVPTSGQQHIREE